jgi:hypothetical protein
MAVVYFKVTSHNFLETFKQLQNTYHNSYFLAWGSNWNLPITMQVCLTFISKFTIKF